MAGKGWIDGEDGMVTVTRSQSETRLLSFCCQFESAKPT